MKMPCQRIALPQNSTMKPAQLAAIGITFSVCAAAAYFFQDSANKDAFFLREFGLPAHEVQDLKVLTGGGMMRSYSVRRFKCEKPVTLRFATDFHAPYSKQWKDDETYFAEFLQAFPEDKEALSEKEQLECLETSYKNASGEIKKTLLINKSQNLYWYRIENSS